MRAHTHTHTTHTHTHGKLYIHTCIYNNYVQIMPTDYAWLFPLSTSLTQSSHQVLNPVALCENFLSCFCGLNYSSLHGRSKVPSACAILPSRPHPCPVFLYTYNDALIAA